jgi:hypothetical protein
VRVHSLRHWLAVAVGPNVTERMTRAPPVTAQLRVQV